MRFLFLAIDFHDMGTRFPGFDQFLAEVCGSEGDYYHINRGTNGGPDIILSPGKIPMYLERLDKFGEPFPDLEPSAPGCSLNLSKTEENRLFDFCVAKLKAKINSKTPAPYKTSHFIILDAAHVLLEEPPIPRYHRPPFYVIPGSLISPFNAFRMAMNRCVESARASPGLVSTDL